MDNKKNSERWTVARRMCRATPFLLACALFGCKDGSSDLTVDAENDLGMHIEGDNSVIWTQMGKTRVHVIDVETLTVSYDFSGTLNPLNIRSSRVTCDQQRAYVKKWGKLSDAVLFEGVDHGDLTQVCSQMTELRRFQTQPIEKRRTPHSWISLVPSDVPHDTSDWLPVTGSQWVEGSISDTNGDCRTSVWDADQCRWIEQDCAEESSRAYLDGELIVEDTSSGYVTGTLALWGTAPDDSTISIEGDFDAKICQIESPVNLVVWSF